MKASSSICFCNAVANLQHCGTPARAPWLRRVQAASRHASSRAPHVSCETPHVHACAITRNGWARPAGALPEGKVLVQGLSNRDSQTWYKYVLAAVGYERIVHRSTDEVVSLQCLQFATRIKKG